MQLLLDKELLNYKLYEDFVALFNGVVDFDFTNSLEYSLYKLPVDDSYKISYVEKLIDILKLSEVYDDQEIHYILHDFLSSKGTYRVRECLEKYLDIKVNKMDYSSNMVLDLEVEVTYNGVNVELLIKLIKELIAFELFYTDLKFLIKRLRHIIEVKNETIVNVGLDKFSKVTGNIRWD